MCNSVRFTHFVNCLFFEETDVSFLHRAEVSVFALCLLSTLHLSDLSPTPAWLREEQSVGRTEPSTLLVADSLHFCIGGDGAFTLRAAPSR